MSGFMPIRLAIREEGKYVNCYIAKPDTMNETILIGSIHITVRENEEIYNNWQKLMEKLFTFYIENIFKVKVQKMIRKPPAEDKDKLN